MGASTAVSIISSAISIFSFLIGALIIVYKLARKVEKAVEKTNAHGDDIKIMMECNLVCLDGLTQLGANGVVTKTRDKMEKYLIERGIGRN